MNDRQRALHDIEDQLRIRFGKPPSTSAAGGTAGSHTVSRLLRQYGGGSRGGTGRHTAASSGPTTRHDSRQQRVVIKASYTVHKAGKASGVLKAHVAYLSRDSASLDGERGEFYDAERQDVDAWQQVRDWQDDRHHFRFIVSPEHGEQIEQSPGGMTQYVRELVARMETDLGTKLEWVAVNHYNTDDLHAHILLRGRDDRGNDLVIPRRYMQHGMRQAAQQIATSWLGERTVDQVQEAMQKQVTAEWYTSLDATIEQHADAARRVHLPARLAHRRLVAGRLAHLQRYGMADKDRHGRWLVNPNLRRFLSDLSLRHDIIKNLHRKIGQDAAYVAPYQSRGGEALTGHVIDIDVHDELRDSKYVLVEDSGSQKHYVRVANRHALGGLEVGGIVSVSGTDPARARTDARIAEVAQRNGGVYAVDAHRRSLPENFKASDIDSFLRAHQRRVETLVKRGTAEVIPGGWRIKDVDALARGEHAATRSGEGVVEVVSARSVASQVNAEAVTWLDRQMYRTSQGRDPQVPFDERLQTAAQQRRQWMTSRGYARTRGDRYDLHSGAFEKLQGAEFDTVARQLEAKHGKPVRALPAGATADGAYRGVVQMHAGTHAVITGRGRVMLAPVKRVPPLEQGASVSVSVNSQGHATITAAARRYRQRHQTSELGRG